MKLHKNTLTGELLEKVLADVKKVFEAEQSAFCWYEQSGQPIQGFIEFVAPPLSLVVAGAGNDAQPLVEIAALLGWHVTVADGRKTHADKGRFPKADKVIVAKHTDLLQQLNTDARTAFVLMTHNYNYDIGLLAQLVGAGCIYIGLLGPKKKLDRMLEELQASGITISEHQKAAIYGPVGLDIGAETPEEIALAIASEIKAVFAKHSAVFLKQKAQPIHSRL